MTDMTPTLPPLPTLPHWCEHGTPFARAMQSYATEYGEQCARAAVPEGMALVPVKVVDFLCGRGPLDGKNFGDLPPEGFGPYWWRKYLAAAPTAPKPATPPAVEARVPDEMPYEKWLAIREGHFNVASDEYFAARPELDTPLNRRIFYGGHCKGYDAAPAAPGPQAVAEPDEYGTQPSDVLRSVWNAMQNSADGDELLSKLEHMRGSIDRALGEQDAQ